MNNRALRRVFQAIELQACHRVISPSRRDQDRERTLVLPSSCARPDWQLLPSCFEGFPIRLSTSFLLSMYIDAPESTTNSLASGFFEECQHCPCFGRQAERSFYPCFWAYWFFARFHASLRAHLSCCKFFPRILEHKDCALEVRTFAPLLAMDPFFPEFFTLCHVPLENWMVWFDPSVPTFRRTEFFNCIHSFSKASDCPGSVFCTTHRRVQWVASDWTRKRNKKSGWWSDLAGLVDNNVLEVNCLQFPEARFDSTCHCDRSPLVWPLVILPAVLLPSFPIRRPRVCAPPGCWRPLRRGRWGWDFTFFCEVPSQICA